MKLPPFLQKLGVKFHYYWPIILRYTHGHSMIPVLPPGTLVWAWKYPRKLGVGDVIVFRHDGKEKIKRIQDLLPGDKVFVLGEHQETSTDSRHFGPIDRKDVVARVFYPNVNPK